MRVVWLTVLDKDPRHAQVQAEHGRDPEGTMEERDVDSNITWGPPAMVETGGFPTNPPVLSVEETAVSKAHGRKDTALSNPEMEQSQWWA